MKPVQVVALVLALAAAGCLGTPKVPDEPKFTWGLGLDTSIDPQRTTPIENRTELAHLFAFANSSIEPIFNRCGALTESRSSNVQRLASQHDMRAFGVLDGACDVHGTERLRHQADDAVANGTIDALYNQLYEKAADLTPKTWAAVRQMPQPGSAVDAEFQAIIQKETVETNGSLERAVRSYAAFNKTGQVGHLYGALNDLTWLVNTLEMELHYAQNYDWMPGHCDVSTLEEEWTRLMAWYERVYSLAEARAAPGEKELGYSSMFGYLESDMLPRLKLLHDNGFVLGLFDWHVDLQFYEAYWNNVNRTVLPTFEEGLYLVHLHRSKLVSIATVGLDDMEEYAVHNWESSWERAGLQAVRPIALQEVTWPYAELHCQPSGSA